MKTGKLIFFLITFFSVTSFSTTGKRNTIPAKGPHLFKIERSRDANEIWYDLNLNKEGELDLSHPIRIYWLKKSGNGKTEPLSWMQKKYGYGINYRKITESSIQFRFVSSLERVFQLKKSGDGYFRVYTLFNNEEVRVTKIYLEMDDASNWIPTVSKIEIHGLDANNKVTRKVIRP